MVALGNSRFARAAEKIDGCSLLVIGFVLAVFHIVTSFVGPLPSFQHRVVHLCLAMMLIPFTGKLKIKHPALKFAASAAIVGIVSVIGVYALSIANDMWRQVGRMSNIDIVLGTMFVAILLFFTWRVVGLALPVISLICIVYALAGPYLPIGIAHRGYSWPRILELLFKGVNGIFGTPLGVSSMYVAVFVVFAALLETSGAGDVFIKGTQALLGKYRGGPAKVSVVASLLFGTISSSSIANVVATSGFTIPLMKKSGYKPEFAAAVETAASGGGQMVPPVMGAAAFIMADIIGSYNEVILAAIVPSILYYLAVFVMIDTESIKEKLTGVPKSELPVFAQVMAKGWYLLLPIIILIFMLVIMRYSPQRSAFYAICLLSALCLFPLKRQKLFKLLKGIANSSSGIATIALTTGTAGIIIALMMLTGIGYNLSSILIGISGGHVMALLLLTMIVSIILGLGMPTSGVYILLATLVVPALIEMGVAKIAAHFFVFYFGILANVTPPVALCAFAAASVAGSDPMKTSFIAFRLCLAGFLLPFLFCLNPAILGIGTPGEILASIITAAIGTFALAIAVQRYFRGKLSWITTIILLSGSILMLLPGRVTDLLGCVLIIMCLGSQYMRSRRREIRAA